MPTHLTMAMLSHFPRAASPDSIALDLGCGAAVHRAVLEHAGFQWAGVDHMAAEAALLADAHSLPFEDSSVEFILTIAVLEHIRYPFVAMAEAFRVLKPGALMIGTVAFLEPFHGDSHYHHTHLGTLNTLRHAGFDVSILSVDPAWSVLDAQAKMILFPRMPAIAQRATVSPLRLAHKLWWRLARRANPQWTEARRTRDTAGAFGFVAYRPV